MYGMKENLLVVTPVENDFSVTAFRVNFIDKEIQSLWRKETAGTEKTDELKKIFALAFYPNSYRVIFSLSPKQAVSHYETVFLDRDDPKKLIDEAEIDNLVSGVLLKLFAESRKVAVKQLDLSELEILLADVKVYEFKIDGRQIINPLKHAGKKISIFLSETFVSRPYFTKLMSILPKRAKSAVFLGTGEATTHLISRFSRKKDFIFAEAGDRHIDLFVSKNGNIDFWSSFNWGKNRLAEKLAKYLNIDPPTSNNVLGRIILGETSSVLKRKFDEIISSEALTLLRGLKNAVSRTKVPLVYVNFPVLLAPKIFPKMIKIIDAKTIADFFGFRFNGRLGKKEENPAFLSVAAVLDFYFLPEEDLMNHLARRRMRWLMPQDIRFKV